MCVAVRPTALQYAHKFPTSPPPANVPIMEACVPLFFIAVICPYRRFISCCCRATVSTDIAILSANSTSGPYFTTVFVSAAAILSRYPSSESSIWFVSGDGPMDAVFPRLCSCPFFYFTAEPLMTAETPKGFSSPSRDNSAHLFATYAFLKVDFHAV